MIPIKPIIGKGGPNSWDDYGSSNVGWHNEKWDPSYWRYEKRSKDEDCTRDNPQCWATSCDGNKATSGRGAISRYIGRATGYQGVGCTSAKWERRKLYLTPNSTYSYVKEAKGSSGRHTLPCFWLDGARIDAKWKSLTDGTEIECTYDIDKITDTSSSWERRHDKLHNIIDDSSSRPLTENQHLTVPLEPLITEAWCAHDDNKLDSECGMDAYDELKVECIKGNYLNTKQNRSECAVLKDAGGSYTEQYDEAAKLYCEANPDKEECSCYNQMRKINAGTEDEYPWCSQDANKDNPGCQVVYDVYKMAQEMDSVDKKVAILSKMNCFYDMCHNDDRNGRPYTSIVYPGNVWRNYSNL